MVASIMLYHDAEQWQMQDTPPPPQKKKKKKGGGDLDDRAWGGSGAGFVARPPLTRSCIRVITRGMFETA